MRTSSVIMGVGLLGLAAGLMPAAGFDGTRTPEGATVAAPLTGPDAPGTALGRATPLAAVPVAPLSAAPRTITPSEATAVSRFGSSLCAVVHRLSGSPGVPHEMKRLARWARELPTVVAAPAAGAQAPASAAAAAPMRTSCVPLAMTAYPD